MPGIKNYYNNRKGHHEGDFNFDPFAAASFAGISQSSKDPNPHSPLGTVVVINSGPLHSVPERFLCPNCEARGQLNRLGVVIQEEGEIPESDSDKYKQCHTCYSVFPIYELEHKGDVFVEDTYELITNPILQNINTPRIVTIDNSTSRKKTDYQKQMDKEIQRRKRNIHPKDKEVLHEIDKGNVISNYSAV